MTPPLHGTTLLNQNGVADPVLHRYGNHHCIDAKSVFSLTLRALQRFIDSVFRMMLVSLSCPDYTNISKRAQNVNVNIKTSTRGEIAHLVIDSTGLKMFGEGE